MNQAIRSVRLHEDNFKDISGVIGTLTDRIEQPGSADKMSAPSSQSGEAKDATAPAPGLVDNSSKLYYINNTRVGPGRSGETDPDRHCWRPATRGKNKMKCDACYDYNKGLLQLIRTLVCRINEFKKPCACPRKCTT